MTERLLVGLAFIAMGVVAIVNRDTLACKTVQSQNRWFRGRQGTREIRMNRGVYVLVGPEFIVFGIGYLIAG